jgi:hypothetical protein
MLFLDLRGLGLDSFCETYHVLFLVDIFCAGASGSEAPSALLSHYFLFLSNFNGKFFVS